MRLLCVGPKGAERALLDDNGRLLGLSAYRDDIDDAFFAGGGLERIGAAHRAGAEIPSESVPF